MKNYYELIDENKSKSTLIITLFIVFVTAAIYFLTYALGFGSSSLLLAVTISTLMSLGSYYYSDQIVLSISSAKPATKKHFPELYSVTENLCLAANLPRPKIYVIEDSAMNAFATGRNPENATICATTGLIKKLNRTELEGVIAHELSHIKHYDILLSSIVSVFVGLITLLADWLIRSSLWGRRRDNDSDQIDIIMVVIGFILAILSPIISQLIQLAISRQREFLADAGAAGITRYPEGLASALEKISIDKEPLEVANKATAHLYISNPLNNLHEGVGWFANLFNTHPPVKERIKALRSL